MYETLESQHLMGEVKVLYGECTGAYLEHGGLVSPVLYLHRNLAAIRLQPQNAGRHGRLLASAVRLRLPGPVRGEGPVQNIQEAPALLRSASDRSALLCRDE